MSWLEIFGWFLAFGFVLSAFFRRGVKVGIEHALKTLNLNSIQIEKLNTELKKSNSTLTKEILS